jgi:hypothetical protein
MDKSRPVVQPAARGLGFTAFPGHDGTASTLPRYYSDARPRDWEPFERSGVHKRDPDRSAGSLCFAPAQKSAAADAERRPTRDDPPEEPASAFRSLIGRRPAAFSTLLSSALGFPGGPFSTPNKEATGTDFAFLNLSLQQGMRTFPPCAFSTSMLSGGSPDL